ncbi:hypothetical protein DPMN_131027 [Dreissena polymorpha]|uniref:Uncharacterized protein n=1 Tax=Dreissena polymorpha TaxID=45954 RepID=A0A9D4JZP1_DREPO|nr:hypothetical protein DPMN_131027 [Dreissena polymorpha]
MSGPGYYLTLVRSDRDIDEDAILKEQLMTNIEPRPTSAMSATSVRSITKVLVSVSEWGLIECFLKEDTLLMLHNDKGF